MKNILNIVNSTRKEKDNDCLFLANTNCKILKKRECENCKFYMKNTPENYQKCVVDVKESIKEYALNHK